MYVALKSFSGPLISMAKGQEREIQDPALVEDLKNAGYIKEIKVKDEIKEIREEKEEVKKIETKKNNRKNTKK